MKSEPSPFSGSIKSLVRGEEVTVLAYENTYYKVSVDGVVGWVLNAWLNDKEGLEAFKVKEKFEAPKEDVIETPIKNLEETRRMMFDSRDEKLKDCHDSGGFTKPIILTKQTFLFMGNSKFVILLNDDNCIDEGDIMRIIFEDETEIVKSNIQDFNCKGIGGYILTKKEMEKMRTTKIYMICTAAYNDSTCSILSELQYLELVETINCLLDEN